jgi:HAD superfamily hydrolase (TIGR01509 family)
LNAFRRNFRLPYWEYLMQKGFTEHEAKGESVVSDYIRFYTELINYVKIFDDVEVTLTALLDKNIEVSMVSHSPKRVIEAVTEKFKFFRFFKQNSIFGMGDYKRQKPHPESIQLALGRLGYSPGEAIYIGDMREDITAATRAEVKSVAIYREAGSYHIESILRGENPTFLIYDLRKILDIVQTDL